METLDANVRDTPLQIVYRYRPVSGQPVAMYLHGVGCSLEDFAEAYEREELADVSLLSFNFPGYGNERTYPAGIRLGIDELADITNQVTEQLEIDRLAVIAHSMGGAVAERFIEAHPEKVTKLIIIEGNLTAHDLIFTNNIARQSRRQFVASGLRKLRRAFETSANPTLQNASAEAVYDNSKSLVEHSKRGDLLRIFLDLDMPRLYVYGEENRASADYYRGKFNAHGIRMAEIPDSGHWPMHNNPNAFYGTIGGFLKQIT